MKIPWSYAKQAYDKNKDKTKFSSLFEHPFQFEQIYFHNGILFGIFMTVYIEIDMKNELSLILYYPASITRTYNFWKYKQYWKYKFM